MARWSRWAAVMSSSRLGRSARWSLLTSVRSFRAWTTSLLWAWYSPRLRTR